MTTQSPNIILAATTSAQHYNWIAAFSAALDALGVSRTTDTGQVVLVGQTTIALPTESAGNAANYFSSPAVYEIRQLVAAGSPTIYLRFDYGVYGNNNATSAQPPYNYPTVRITIGGSTDGAGNIKPIQLNAVNPNMLGGGIYAGSSSLNSGAPSSNPQECDFASDGQNYLTIMLGENAPSFENNSILSFGIERSINPSTGLYDNAGYAAFCGQNAGNCVWAYGDFINSQQWQGSTYLPAIAPPFPLAGNVSVVDLFPFIGSTNVPKGAPLIALSYYGSAISSPVSFPAQLYSVAHTYKACPRSKVNADPWNTGTKIALRFD